MPPCVINSQGLYALVEAAAPPVPPSVLTEAVECGRDGSKTHVLTCNLVFLRKGVGAC